MKKCLLLGLFLSSIFTLQAQELFFHIGKNLTSYEYKNYELVNVDLQNDIGFNYEVGFISAKESNNP